MSQHWPKETRERALTLIARTATRSKSGRISYVMAGQQLREEGYGGISRETLRYWWNRRHEYGMGEDSTGPPKREQPLDDPIPEKRFILLALQRLGREDPKDLIVGHLADIYQQRHYSTSDTARATLTKQAGVVLEQHRREERAEQELTPAQWEQKICSMPERIVGALERSPWLWHDPRVINLIDGRDIVPQKLAQDVLYRGMDAAPEGWPYYIPGD